MQHGSYDSDNDNYPLRFSGANEGDTTIGNIDLSDTHNHTITVNNVESAHTHNISVQNQSGGGTETRPRNVALLACIKY